VSRGKKANPIALMKVCSRCREEKPRISFSPQLSACKECRRVAGLAAYHEAMQDEQKRKRLAEKAKARYHAKKEARR
jgi:hypothetical protein